MVFSYKVANVIWRKIMRKDDPYASTNIDPKAIQAAEEELAYQELKYVSSA